MTWVSLDDKFHSNPKVIAAGLDGAGLYARALAYCGDHLTDGYVPAGWAREVASKRLCDKLCTVRLWTEADDSYRIPDYLDLNPSREEVEAKRADLSEKRSKAGKLGAEARWQNDGKGDGKSDGKTMAKEWQNDGPSPSPLPLTTGSTYFHDVDAERRRELERIYVRISKPDSGTAGVLVHYGRQLPFGAIAKVRESVESRHFKVRAGWVVNALKDEIKERAV